MTTELRNTARRDEDSPWVKLVKALCLSILCTAIGMMLSGSFLYTRDVKHELTEDIINESDNIRISVARNRTNLDAHKLKYERMERKTMLIIQTLSGLIENEKNAGKERLFLITELTRLNDYLLKSRSSTNNEPSG